MDNEIQQQSIRAQTSKFLQQEPSHRCQYFNSLKKAQKAISRKNRQIQTLNRIIKNLKQDISSLSSNKQHHHQETHSLKQQLQKFRSRIAELQLKQIDYQRVIAEQRLQNAIKIKKDVVSRGKMKRDHSLDYFSECHLSRNTFDQRVREQEKYGTFYNRKQNIPRPLNMGELFMGRKSRIEMSHNLSSQSSWGKVELLNQPSKGMLTMQSSKNLPKRNFFQSQLNFQNAISYLKKQNQHLKIPFF